MYMVLDMAAASELIASKKTVDQIKEEIGAEFAPLSDLKPFL